MELIPIRDVTTYQQEALVTASMAKGRAMEGAVRALGLAGEAGECAEEFGKWLARPGAGLALRDKLSKELGDVMWYAATIAEWLGVGLTFDFATLQASAGRRVFAQSAPATLMRDADSVAELMKKVVGHDKPLESFKGAEVGLVLDVWYAIAFVANTAGLDLAYVAAENIRKLRARHNGGGFTAAAQNAKADEALTP